MNPCWAALTCKLISAQNAEAIAYLYTTGVAWSAFVSVTGYFSGQAGYGYRSFEAFVDAVRQIEAGAAKAEVIHVEPSVDIYKASALDNTAVVIFSYFPHTIPLESRGCMPAGHYVCSFL